MKPFRLLTHSLNHRLWCPTPNKLRTVTVYISFLKPIYFIINLPSYSYKPVYLSFCPAPKWHKNLYFCVFFVLYSSFLKPFSFVLWWTIRNLKTSSFLNQNVTKLDLLLKQQLTFISASIQSTTPMDVGWKQDPIQYFFLFDNQFYLSQYRRKGINKS